MKAKLNYTGKFRVYGKVNKSRHFGVQASEGPSAYVSLCASGYYHLLKKQENDSQTYSSQIFFRVRFYKN